MYEGVCVMWCWKTERTRNIFYLSSNSVYKMSPSQLSIYEMNKNNKKHAKGDKEGKEGRREEGRKGEKTLKFISIVFFYFSSFNLDYSF